jgi:hypothetical protein
LGAGGILLIIIPLKINLKLSEKLNYLKNYLLYNIIKKKMDFSKMNRNDKIELCFEKINDLELLDDKMETSASGVAQSKASIKQNMKRNKTVVFNAMLEALSMILCERDNSARRNFKKNKQKDREIENLELRLSEVDTKMKVLEQTIKEQSDMIELMKINLRMD